MGKARTLSFLSAVIFLIAGHNAFANEHGHHDAPAPKAEATHETIPGQMPDAAAAPVVAMDAGLGEGLRAGELITAGAETRLVVGRSNMKVELSPRSVAEFDPSGAFRLLRGSAAVETNDESSVRTPGAKVEFVGRSILSYDYQEKSTSVFVLEGQARVVNPHREDSSLRLTRFRGATLVVGEVVPQLIRQLDVGGVHAWMKGFSWPEARRQALLHNMPGELTAAKEEHPAHLESAKIEDYFSSIDTADELHQPDYYEKKFDDPDKVVAEQNSKQGGGKVLSPEEAALISLPKTQIDLGFELGPEFLTADQKAAEVARVEPKSVSRRGPASLEKPKKVAAKKKIVITEQGDPEVSMVLDRLRQVRSGNAVFSQMPSAPRGPASVPVTAVPDPVYDYSQNF